MKMLIKSLLASLFCLSSLSAFAQPLTSGVKAKEIDYYFVKPDLRRCAAPLCGGVFVQKVNERSMRCPNGKRQLQCYISHFDMKEMGGGALDAAKHSSFIVAGVITATRSNGEELGDSQWVSATLSASQVLYRAGKASDVGRFWSLKSNLSRCITQPCFYGEAQLINAQFKRSFSDYDLSKAGLSRVQVAQMKSRLKKGAPVFTKAIRRSYKGETGRGIRFVPTEVYLPLNDAL